MLTISPWLKLALMASLVIGTLFFWSRYVDSVEERGEVRERARWQLRELEAAGKYADRINELTARNREIEHQGTVALNNLGADYEIQLAALEQRRRNDVLSAATRRLRDSGAAPCAPASGGPLGSAPSSAPSGDGQTGRELSESFTRMLFEFANEADRNTEQLISCQGVIKSYLEMNDAYARATAK